MEDDIEVLDLVVVGAGVYGICVANTYLTLHPSANIKVLDSDPDVGGVWSTARLYPQFWSQTGARLTGYPDVPFQIPEGSPTYHDLFEAKHLSKYLEDYVTDHEYDGHSLRDRFVFNCYANSIYKRGDVWTVKGRLNDQPVSYQARKVIVATGLSSLPNMPELPGLESLKGLTLHQKDFGRSRILTPEEPNMEKHTNITVLGGSKSAADIAYAAATDVNKQRKVNWIIRKSGTGPLATTKANGFGKYRNLPETGSTRAIAGLSSANPYLPENWWDWFLHKTWLGEWISEKIWRRTEIEAAIHADFYGREGALPGFEGLHSHANVRWRTGPLGLIQHDDYWDVIARKVQVYRQDIASLKADTVVLEDGNEVKTDVLLCATGWTGEHPQFSPDESERIGLPLKLDDVEHVKQERQRWSKLEEAADRKVLARWPYMANVPKFDKHPVTTTSYKLYNMTIPIDDQSITFLGLPLVPNSYHVALIQTLWAIAAMDGTLKLPPVDEVEKDVAFTNVWCRRRYPGHGHLGNVLEFEMVSYTDRLLEQLGLSSHLPKDSWWKKMTDPCLASDYAGLIDEYRLKYKV